MQKAYAQIQTPNPSPGSVLKQHPNLNVQALEAQAKKLLGPNAI